MECKWGRWWFFADDIFGLMAWIGFAFWIIVVAALLVKLLAYIFKGA